MSERHFPVWEWEPGEPVDEAHLRECADCRRRWEARKFLSHQAAQAPQPEAAPFFASRVARSAFTEAISLWDLVERASRRLAPVFGTLALAALAALVVLSPAEPRTVDPDYAELLVEPQGQSELTLDDVLLSLSFATNEEEGLEEQ